MPRQCRVALFQIKRVGENSLTIRVARVCLVTVLIIAGCAEKSEIHVSSNSIVEVGDVSITVYQISSYVSNPSARYAHTEKLRSQPWMPELLAGK